MDLLIVGTGGMARAHARHFSAIDGVVLTGAVDPDAGRLAAFCDEFDIGRRFSSLAAALEWNGFVAATNVTPDAMHHSTTLDLLAAGKHVFCEKPLATNHADAQEMADAARARGLVGMVNLTYRNVAELHRVRELVLGGELGALRHVEASYLQSWLVSDAWGRWSENDQWLWRLSRQHGSNGVLGDVGIHIFDFLSFGVAADVVSLDCRLQTFDKAPGNRVGEYHLDANDSFTASLELEGGALGVIHATRWAPGHLNSLHLRAYGSAGGVDLVHTLEGTCLKVCLGDDVQAGTWREMDVPPCPTNYQKFVAAVAAKRPDAPDFQRGADMQKVLDLCVRSDESGSRFAI